MHVAYNTNNTHYIKLLPHLCGLLDPSYIARIVSAKALSYTKTCTPNPNSPLLLSRALPDRFFLSATRSKI